MSAATPLDYAARCERYARQRGWAYDEHRLSIDHLTPRQTRRALRKERRADPWNPHPHPHPGYGLYNDGDDGIYDDVADPLWEISYPEEDAYCVTPGCNCCDGGDD